MCSHHDEGNALEVMPYHLMCTSEGEDGTLTYYCCFDSLYMMDLIQVMYLYLVGCYDKHLGNHEKAPESTVVVHSLINHILTLLIV